MTREELVHWCSYFWNPETKSCECGYWKDGRRIAKNSNMCPVLKEGNPIYVPEPVRGNPLGKDIIFLGANPGGGKEEEKDTCPWWDTENDQPGPTALASYNGTQWQAALASQEAFAEFNLTANAAAAHDVELATGYKDDAVTLVAAGTLAWRDGHLDHPQKVKTDSQAWHDFADKVAVLNVMHCKSAGYAGQSYYERRVCGLQTWKLLVLLRTQTVVAYGRHVRKWYRRVSGRAEPTEGTTTRHEWGDGPATTFYWICHPGHGQHHKACAMTARILPR